MPFSEHRGASIGPPIWRRAHHPNVGLPIDNLDAGKEVIASHDHLPACPCGIPGGVGALSAVAGRRAIKLLRLGRRC